MYEEAGLKSRLACKCMRALQSESSLDTWSTPTDCTPVVDSLPSRHDSVLQYVAIVLQIVAVRCRVSMCFLVFKFAGSAWQGVGNMLQEKRGHLCTAAFLFLGFILR